MADIQEPARRAKFGETISRERVTTAPERSSVESEAGGPGCLILTLLTVPDVHQIIKLPLTEFPGSMSGTADQSPRAFLMARLRLADIQARKP